MAELPVLPPESPAPVLPPATPGRTGLRLLWPLASILALLVLTLGILGGLGTWMLTTEAGSQWLVPRLPLLQTQGFRGALLSKQWRADKVQFTWAGGKASLTLEDLRADGLSWHWRPHPSAWLGVDVQRFTARKATVVTGPPGQRPLPVPVSIAYPVQVAMAEARVDELLVDQLAPMQNLALKGLVLDAQPGAEHRVAQASVDWMGATLKAQARIGNRAPLPLTLDGTVVPTHSADAPRWAAVVHATGTAALFDLTATLRGVAQGGHAAPALDLSARLQLLQAWPLAGLSLRTQALDLAALSPKAPQTRLSGSVELQSSARDAPMQATVTLDNAQPGRWNERRLPLRRVVLEAQGNLAQPDRVAVTRFEFTLADALREAGHWTGSALWQGHELTLNTQLASVMPQRLDGRAAAMTLTGPLTAKLLGLPSPDGSRKTAEPVVRLAPRIEWKLDLQGRLDAAPQPVQISIEGSADGQGLELKRALARAGAASLDLRATVARAAPGEWKVDSDGTVLDFDPLPWWPGEAGSAWRRGPHRLSGDWKFELRLPGDAARLPPLALAQRLVGNGTLRVRHSVLAGVPLAAEVKLGYAPAAGPSAGTLQAELQLGGNQIVFDGRGDPAGSGEADRLRVELKAGALAALAPLARLLPAWTDGPTLQGAATASLTAEGRWPGLRSEGSARLSQFRLGPLALAHGSAVWRMDLRQAALPRKDMPRTDARGDPPLALQLELAGLQYGAQRADHLRADLRGTLAEHRIDITGAMPVVPPPVIEQALGIQVQSGTRAHLKARGSWRADASAGGGRWRALVEQLVIGSWDGNAGDTPPASVWAEARDLSAEFQFNGEGKLLALQAQPGRAQLSDTVALRWDEVRLDLRGEQAQLQLRADIEPFALAPLLARAQPTMGWQGDLRLTAHVDIRAAKQLDADIVFERHDGDLHVSSGEGTQLLGLSDFRLALSAHDGLWNFTPVLRGRSLGEITGRLRVQTTPERRWPHAEAAIEGELVAHVADIGIWSTWVPPGWRLKGELRSGLNLSGTLGAPRYNGALAGSGLGVRNLLQGVNVSEGQIAVSLSGDTAKVEHFTLRGGEGSLSVTGEARLGKTPQARLQIKAEHFRVLGRVDRMVIASGNAELLLLPDQVKLDGKVTIDEATIDASRSDAPSLDDDVTVRRASAAEVVAPELGTPRKCRFVAGVDIDLGEKTRARWHGVDTGLRGQLRFTTPNCQPQLSGTIHASQGTYIAYGQKLEIDRGTITFSGPVDNARLDVLALRPQIDNRVGVAITGTLRTLRIRLHSEPEMSDTDKLSWLVLGRAPDGLGRNDTALLQRAAVALLSGEGEAPTDALMKSLGIDELSLRQGDTDVRETVFSLGKQLSRRWYLGYERGVNATTGTWQLIYRIAQRFTLRAQSGLDNSLDVIWTWRLQEAPADAGMRKLLITPP
ncbi:MAG: translocation/assembly module TamB domain-containing protein [Rubrivivax sp.]|nr:translocation/assembly module TamB domain-containing protein [Rubrivivax sp.]